MIAGLVEAATSAALYRVSVTSGHDGDGAKFAALIAPVVSVSFRRMPQWGSDKRTGDRPVWPALTSAMCGRGSGDRSCELLMKFKDWHARFRTVECARNSGPPRGLRYDEPQDQPADGRTQNTASMVLLIRQLSTLREYQSMMATK